MLIAFQAHTLIDTMKPDWIFHWTELDNVI